MKIILASLVAAVVIAVGAAYVLNAEQRPAYEAFTTSGARVGDPGHNLVGDKWDGRGQDQQGQAFQGRRPVPGQVLEVGGGPQQQGVNAPLGLLLACPGQPFGPRPSGGRHEEILPPVTP